MLTVPAHTRIGSTTIYRDDTDFFRFYAVPDAPRLRVGPDGEPVLLLVIYAVSDEDRAAHPELPTGGGYLVLDTEFEVPSAELADIVTSLQPMVAADWERLRVGTDEERARPGVAGTTEPPTVQMATPTYTSGSVKLDTSQSSTLVAARVAEGEPSLLTGNVASFNLDLTPLGAGFLSQSLAPQPDGVDLAPLQVGYDLTFWARLPPASIHMEVNAERLYEYVQERSATHGVQGCTTYEYEHTAVDTESLTLSGAVTVQIDNGSGSLPDDVIAELRAYAFDTLKELVETTFFTEQTVEPRASTEPTPLPLLWGGRHLVRKQFDEQTMSIELDLEQRSVVQWPIHPTGTLSTLLGGSTGHIRRFELGDDFFANLDVTVTVFTDFERVDHVDVEIEYTGTTADGTAESKGTLLTLDATAPSARWTVGLIGSSREYRYRYRAVMPGASAGGFSTWQRHDKPTLPIAIAAPGLVHVEAIAGAIDFDELISSVQVTFAYEDLPNGVPREEGVVVLAAGVPSGRYERELSVPVSAGLMYRVRFFLHSGDVTAESRWQPVLGDRVVINQPRESVLQVRLAPTGTGWLAGVTVLVDLEYEDPANDLRATATYDLRSLDESATWRVYLHDEDRRAYRYRWVASFDDGSFASHPWTDNPGDSVLPIAVNRPGIDVTVRGDLLDFSTAPLTEVTVRHVPTGRAETLVFANPSPQVWHVAVPEGSPTVFAHTVTHFPVSTDPVVLPERTESDPMIVLPPYRPATGGTLRVPVVGWLVDPTTTPVVGVDLVYEDAEHGVLSSASFTIDESQRAFDWVVSVADSRITEFRYRISYFTTTGAQLVGEWVTSDVPRVVVPAMAMA